MAARANVDVHCGTCGLHAHVCLPDAALDRDALAAALVRIHRDLAPACPNAGDAPELFVPIVTVDVVSPATATAENMTAENMIARARAARNN